MTLRHLECALMVVKAGSINGAAKKMLVSQPYLSGMINSLEKELGFPILIRSSKGIQCTAQGRLFMEHAENILNEIEVIKSLSENRELPLRVATYYSRFIIEHFFSFHNSTDNKLADRYREMGNMEVIEAVAKRDYSIGIIYHAKSKKEKFMKLAEKNNLEYHTLFDRLGTYLVMTDEHPLASKDHITYEELRDHPVVFFDDVSTMLYMVEHLKLPESATDIWVSDRGAFMDALLSGRYLSVINTPYPEKEKLFVLKDISDCLAKDADIEVGSAYLIRRDHHLTHREKEFIRSLERDTVTKEI